MSYLIGLFLGNYLYFPTRPTLIGIATLLLIFLVAILRQWKWLSIALFPTIFILIGGLFINLYTHPSFPKNHISNFLKDDYLNVQGSLYKPPKLLEDRSRFYVNAERVYLNEGHVNVNGKLLLTIGDTGINLKYGDRIRFICKLYRPRNFNNPGGFDYSRYLAFQGISATGYLKSSGEIVKMAEGDGNFFRKAIEGLREKIRRFIDEETELPNRYIIKALLLGEKGEIPRKRREDFTAAGVAHILAISGLHLGFIALVAFAVFRGILRYSERLMLAFDINKVSAVLTVFPVLFYAYIAGFSVSTFRATIMIMTFLTAIIIDRQRDLYNTLAVAALIISVISPTAIFDVSFQLSFVSVLVILFLIPRFLYYLSLIPGLPAKSTPSATKKTGRYIGFLALVSIAATLGTGPIVAYHFNRVAPLGFISNIVIVPMVGFLIIPLSLLVALTIFVSPSLASLFLGLDSIIAGSLVDLVGLFAHLPSVSFWVTTPTILEIILFYLFIAALFNIKRLKRVGWITLVLLLFIGADYFYWHYANNLDPDFHVTFLSVGQGDSAVVEFPGGKRMLIDGGGFYNDSFDTGRNIIAPFLWKKKIKRIDYLILSHPHPDHLNGLRFIARNFNVREIWASGQGINLESYNELMDIIEDRGIKKVKMDVNTPTRYINGVRVDIYNPPVPLFREQEIGLHQSLNNNSLVVKLTFKGVSFLFTGDIHEEAENILVEFGDRLKSTVLKVPHHGSSTSSTKGFLARVQPSYAVFSVGYKNRFGFPKKEVVERYRDLGCKIYQTDRDGAIAMVTDGEELRVKSSSPLGKRYAWQR